ADVLDLALEGAVVVEHLDAGVAGVGGVDVALGIDGDAVDAGELAGGGASLAPRLDEHSVLREFRDARVAAAVGHEDVALRVPRHVGGTIEDVLRRAGSGRSAATTTAGVAAAAGRVTATAALAAGSGGAAGRIRNRFRLASEQERDPALRIELHHHRGILVD